MRVLCLLIAVSAPLASIHLQAADRTDLDRPNIVLILADDLGYETVGCYGGTSYGTPNIDALAAEGIRFDQAFAMPLCTNTRIQLMTGRYNQRNWKAFGILDPGEQTFGSLLQQAGYKTCVAGKWQLQSYDPVGYPGADLRRGSGAGPLEAGFARYSLWHTGHTEDKGSRYADPVIDQDGQLRTGTQGEYGPDLWVEFIGDFLRENREHPFFVYYSMALPHNPMVPTPDSPEWQDPTKRLTEETRFAADMIRYTDKMVGRVVQQLEELGLRERTLILFYSDNGTNQRVTSKLGDRLVRGGKGLGTDLGIRVPLIANWKGVTPVGSVSSDLIDSVDFLPTMLDVAGVSHPEAVELDGMSFAPQLHGQQGTPRPWVYIHQDPRPGWDKDQFSLIRLARDQDYKLYEDGRLFDMGADPFEESPISIASDSDRSRRGRIKLQQVLDSMKPYPMFDPDVVPRPNPSDLFGDYEFHDVGGYVVAEAEMLPVPRDESWEREAALTGYTGLGYLRALRDARQAPAQGIARVPVRLKTAGRWRVGFRWRRDHRERDHENSFWVKVDGGPWMLYRGTESGDAGRWQWTGNLHHADTDARLQPVFDLDEKHHDIWVAPRSANVKIDRIAVYQDDRRQQALSAATPVSPFHPWASP